MRSKALVLLVASFLLVILIYSSVAKTEVSAKKIVSTSCFRSEPTLSGATSAETCCYNTYDTATGKRLDRVCQKCEYNSSGKVIDCREDASAERTISNSTGLPSRLGTALPPGNNTGAIPNGQTGLPSRLGNALPSGNSTGTPGKTSIFNPIRNATNAIPGNNNTGTLPPGSIIKVPPGTIGSATNPSNNTGTPPPGSIFKVPPGSLNPAGNATNPSNNTGGTLPPTEPGCGPGTDNSTCNTNTSTPNTTQSTPTEPGCGPGTDNSTCSTSTPNPQSTHKGSNLGSSTSTGSNSTSH